MMWAVQARVGIHASHHELLMKDLPTFYLDERVQGILTSDHAEVIAMEIINPHGLYHDSEITITVVKVS